MVSTFSAIFPPRPTFTEADLPSLAGKVYIITGAASGVGFELARMLYSKHATVYMAARSVQRATDAITKLQNAVPESQGTLKPMVVDLADLKTLKPAVVSFLKAEARLDVLFQNAGVMRPPAGSKDNLGHDLKIATHCIAPFLLAMLLEDILKRTAATLPPYSVRIVWVESMFQLGAPPGGMSFDEKGAPQVLPKSMENYMQSKVGGAWLAHSFAKRLDSNRVMSLSVHPGLIKTELQRTMPFVERQIMGLIFKPATYGAYTELFAGFSDSITAKHNGGYVMAWGRIVELPEVVAQGTTAVVDGGNSKTQQLWKYCETETMAYM